MRDISVEDCPWIFLDHTDDLMISHGWVHNVKLHPVAVDTAKYLRVDGPDRARLQAIWNKPNYWPAIAFAVLIVIGTLPAAAVVRKRRNRRVRVRPGGKS
jgi:hypothetical protein